MDSIKLSRDRIEYFSDAVFAIAITLLIIEVEVPGRTEIHELGVWEALRQLIPSFIGFFISFMVIALYWRSHLQASSFIKNFDSKLLWLNIWLLFYIVLLPFSTSFYAKNFFINGPFIFYCLNLLLISLYNYLFLNHIIKKDGFSEHLNPVLAKWMKYRAIVSIFIWAFSILVSFVLPIISRFIFLLIFVIQYFIDRHFKREQKKTLIIETEE